MRKLWKRLVHWFAGDIDHGEIGYYGYLDTRDGL